MLSNLPSQEQVCFNETKEIKTAVEKIECRIETERECQENVVNKCKEVYSDIKCEKVSLLRTYLLQFLLLDSSLTSDSDQLNPGVERGNLIRASYLFFF